MTALDLLKNALAIVGNDTSETDSYKTSALIHINMLLSDLFDINNQILVAGGGDALTGIPLLALEGEEDLDDIDMSDTGYAEILLRNVMPWGLARMIGLAENYRNVGYIANTYEENKARATVATEESITDAYGDSEESEEESEAEE